MASAAAGFRKSIAPRTNNAFHAHDTPPAPRLEPSFAAGPNIAAKGYTKAFHEARTVGQSFWRYSDARSCHGDGAHCGPSILRAV